MKEIIDLCVELLFNDNPKVDGFTITDLRELLTVTLSESLVLFDGEHHKQIGGVEVSSPLGSTFANISLSYHEQIWLKNCPYEFDGIFLLFRSKDRIEIFRYYLNCQHPNINFTSEKEENNSISLLDIKIRRLTIVFLQVHLFL